MANFFFRTTPNAEIKEIDKNRNTARVEYIEFGDGEEVVLENLKKFGTHVVGRDGELVIDGAVRFSLFLMVKLKLCSGKAICFCSPVKLILFFFEQVVGWMGSGRPLCCLLGYR